MEKGLVWKMVEDQYGVNLCLVMEGSSIVLYPQTMISKRIERGEKIDVFDLFNGICSHIEDLKQKGY